MVFSTLSFPFPPFFSSLTILSNTSSLLLFIIFSYTADCSCLLPNTWWSTQYAVGLVCLTLVCSLNMFINSEWNDLWSGHLASGSFVIIDVTFVVQGLVSNFKVRSLFDRKQHTYVRVRGRTYIYTCRSYVQTLRDFTNGASLAWRLGRHIVR